MGSFVTDVSSFPPRPGCRWFSLSIYIIRYSVPVPLVMSYFTSFSPLLSCRLLPGSSGRAVSLSVCFRLSLGGCCVPSTGREREEEEEGKREGEGGERRERERMVDRTKPSARVKLGATGGVISYVHRQNQYLCIDIYSNQNNTHTQTY